MFDSKDHFFSFLSLDLYTKMSTCGITEVKWLWSTFSTWMGDCLSSRYGMYANSESAFVARLS